MSIRLKQISELGQEIEDIKFKIKVLKKLAELACLNNKPVWLNMSEQLEEPPVYRAPEPTFEEEMDYGFNQIVQELNKGETAPKNPLLNATCFWDKMETIAKELVAGKITPDDLSKVKTCQRCNCEMLKLKNQLATKFSAPSPMVDPYQDYRALQEQAKTAAMLSLLFGPSEVLRLCQCLKPMLDGKLERLQKEYHELCALEFGPAPDQK